MRIGLNGITFAPGRMGGMETYFRNLINHLQRIDHDNEYLLLCDERHARELLPVADRFRAWHVNYAHRSLKWFLRGALRSTIGLDILEHEIASLPVDVIHHPFTVLTPQRINIPSVLTFWDMQQEFYPDFFPAHELAKRRRSYRASAEAATRIIVSSGFTRQCLEEKYGIAPGKIDVIHTGYGREYHRISDEKRLAGVRIAHGLEKPFLFYPAAHWPHKNHLTLLAALKLMIERWKFDGELVLTGIAMEKNNDVLREISRLGLERFVRILGYVPRQDLPCLYTLASLLAFPSLFEGFGIPLVEALACGCPVVCSDAASLPEVAGSAGVLFEPRSAEDMAQKIWSVWSSKEQQNQLRQRGLERARLFDWEETARKTLAVYRKALA
jgi:glycosyltransferase involved in cell wall biosynthesis